MDMITAAVTIVALVCATVMVCVIARASADANRPADVKIVQVERMQVSPSQSSGFLLPAPLPDLDAIRERANMMAYLIEAHGMSGDQAWQHLRSWAYAHGRPELVDGA